MSIPTFGGIAIWGEAPTIRPKPNPVAIQINAYPRVHGLQVIRHGSRGLTLEINGTLRGVTETALFTAENAVRLLQGTAASGTLIDTLGASWPDAIILTFEPVGEAELDPNGYWRDYQATVLVPV